MIGQILSNAIKYRKDNLQVEFSARAEKNTVSLFISDITHVPYAVVAALIGIVLMVVNKIDRTKNDMVMDMPFIYVGSQDVFMLSLCYCVGKLFSDSVGFLIIYFSRLKGLYQMVGEIVHFLYGLCKRKSKLNVCRFIAAPKGGHKHFPVCFIRVLDYSQELCLTCF